MQMQIADCRLICVNIHMLVLIFTVIRSGPQASASAQCQCHVCCCVAVRACELVSVNIQIADRLARKPAQVQVVDSDSEWPVPQSDQILIQIWLLAPVIFKRVIRFIFIFTLVHADAYCRLQIHLC